MSKIGVREGDILARPLFPSRSSLTFPSNTRPVPLGMMRPNVFVRKAEVKGAIRVVLGPAQKNLLLQDSGEALQRAFLHRPMVAGDVVSTSIQQRLNSADQRTFDERLRGFCDLPAYGLQKIRLIVVSTQPRGIVQINENAVVELRPQFEEPKEARRANVTYDDIGGLDRTSPRFARWRSFR